MALFWAIFAAFWTACVAFVTVWVWRRANQWIASGDIGNGLGYTIRRHENPLAFRLGVFSNRLVACGGAIFTVGVIAMTVGWLFRFVASVL